MWLIAFHLGHFLSTLYQSVLLSTEATSLSIFSSMTTSRIGQLFYSARNISFYEWWLDKMR